MMYNIMRTNGNVSWLVKSVHPTGKETIKAMGERVVDMQFTLPAYVDFKINDFIALDGETYKINLSPTVEKKAKRLYEYTIQFEHEFYDLAKIQIQGLDSKNGYLEPNFSVMGNADTIINLIVENMNRNYSGWSVGTVDTTDYKLFSFSSQNCLQALNQLASDFKTEFWIENKTIHLQKREQDSGLTFAYGQGQGLYNILRQNKTNANIVTRLYVRGSSENLPIGYRDYASNLLLPGGLTYIQDNAKVAMYGLIEATQTFDIKPERIGTVTSIVLGDGNWRFFTDSSMDFDVNDHKINDAVKITFNTGQLAGYTFTLSNYNHPTKTFTINKNDEEKSFDIPSNSLRPQVGDEYVILNIQMPSSYVSNGENRLLNAGQAYYDQNSDPKFLLSYSAKCDRLFIKKFNIDVQLGSTATITDPDMGLNIEVRIASYVRDLQDRNVYDDVEWSDSIGTSEIVRQYAQQQKTLKLIESSGLLNPDAVRKNIFLNRLSELNGYLMLGGNKISAGLADYATLAARSALADFAMDSDKWDGRQFDDFLNQPVKTTSDINVKSLTSTSFVGGFTGSGFQIDQAGNATFDNLTVRKQFNVYELVLNKISGTNGALAVTDTVKISAVGETANDYLCQIETDGGTIPVPFVLGDLLRCQVFNGTSIKYYFGRVSSIAANGFSIDKASKVGGGIPAAGDVVARFGNVSNTNRQGLLYLTSSDNNSPYLDVLDGVNSDNLSGKTKVRLGKLNGINDPAFGALEGYGLYAENAYIKGRIEVTGGNAQTIAGSQALATAAQNNAITQATSQAAADATVKASAAQVAAIEIAANDAAAKANAAEQNAYNGAVAEAQTKANTAQAAAQTYAAAQAAYEREVAKAYADGIVTAEEAARIADANAKLQAAKDDAQNKVNAAIISANGYADAKALATISAAQTYADNTAQTKANAAQANAVSQASTDAQNKANAAQAAAATLSQQLVNGVKIGGRNLFYNGADRYYVNSVNPHALQLVNFKPNTEYAVSLDARHVAGAYILHFEFNGGNRAVDLTTTDEWLRYSFVMTTDSNPIFYTWLSGGAGGIDIKNIMIVEGNKPTSFVPAPEDVQNAIDAARSTADYAVIAYNNLTTNLKSLAYADVVELAKLGTTIIDNGKIKTTLIDADYIRANVVNAGYVNTLSLDAVAIKSGIIDSARINASQILVNSGGAKQSDVNTAINSAINQATGQAAADATVKASAAQVAAIQAAANDATAKVSAVNIGGRNYMLNSGIVRDINSHSPIFLQNGNFPLNTEMAISFDAILVSGSNILHAEFNGGNRATDFAVTNQWKRYSTVMSTIAQSTFYMWLMPTFAAEDGTLIQVRNIMIVAGNKPMDYVPAPEDIASDAQVKANAAQTAAQNYAAAQAAYEREVAKAYADGIVTAEEAARIADANAKLQAAKDDAQNKINVAVASANGYTDTKALATISAAQTYADNTAQTKANAAQANAVSQASTDAQNKANAAQAAAATLSQQLVNSLSVGAVNYFSNVATGLEFHKSSLITRGIGSLEVNGHPNNDAYVRMVGVIKSSGFYTISFEVKTQVGWGNNRINFNQDAQFFYNSTTEWTYHEFTANIPNYPKYGVGYDFIDFTDLSGQAYQFRNIKIEKGNKATAWSPAIEDTKAAIDSARNTADYAVIAYNNLTTNLKSLAYLDVVEAAKLGSTVIEGGKIKTNLLDADYIRSNVINAGYIQSLDIVATNIQATTGTIGGWSLSSDRLFSGTESSNYIALKSGSSPELYMKNSDQVSGEYSSINTKGLFAMSTGNYLPTSYANAVKAVAGFKLKLDSEQNSVALYAGAPSTRLAFLCDGQSIFNGIATFSDQMLINNLIKVQSGNLRIDNIQTVGGTVGSAALRIMTSGNDAGKVVIA